jgi:hypothetical protein
VIPICQDDVTIGNRHVGFHTVGYRWAYFDYVAVHPHNHRARTLNCIEDGIGALHLGLDTYCSLVRDTQFEYAVRPCVHRYTPWYDILNST